MKCIDISEKTVNKTEAKKKDIAKKNKRQKKPILRQHQNLNLTPDFAVKDDKKPERKAKKRSSSKTGQKRIR